MDFEYSAKCRNALAQVRAFMGEFIYPNEAAYYEQHNSSPDRWQPVPMLDGLKEKARQAGFWNLFLPESEAGAGLSNLDYAPLCEDRAQGRLGPGRIHHCMRIIGVAERALSRMCDRLMSRTAFGKKVYEHSIWEERVADARIDIECARLLTLKAAHMMDTVGNKVARAEIAMIKVKAPIMALGIIDDAIQAHGGCGVSDDFGLAHAYAQTRALRLADGPDAVHRRTVARIEFKRQAERGGAPR